jgi:O-glycosyl hydrolase
MLLPSRRAVLKGTLAGVTAAALEAKPRPDVIDAGQEHQIIDNFGASDAWTIQKLDKWSVENRDRLADLLFSREHGIGLSCWRFNIGGGINPKITNPWRTVETFELSEGRYDWTRQAGQRWFLGAAKARGVPRFLTFVNSPPARMTRNRLTFCNKTGYTTTLKPGYEGQYARYLTDILDHFRNNPDESQRIRFDYVSPVNEPQWNWARPSQEGNRASNGDIKRILRAVDAKMTNRNLPTEVAALESGSLQDMWQLDAHATTTWKAPYGNYLEAFLGDPEMKKIMSRRISYHDYGSDRVPGELVPNRKKLAAKFREFPDCKLWMSEYCILTGSDGKGGHGRDLTMKTALEVARIIHLDLTLVGVSAWQWWLAVSGGDFKDGLIYTDWRKPGDEESIYPARLFWALGNYSRFVRPGMHRIEMTVPGEDIEGIMGSAYKNEAERQIVAVYVNRSTTPHSRHIDFHLGERRWKLQSITPYITSEAPGHELKRMPPANRYRIHVPARSVATFVAQFA